jgi:hypothetical protein
MVTLIKIANKDSEKLTKTDKKTLVSEILSSILKVKGKQQIEQADAEEAVEKYAASFLRSMQKLE